jgi:hypothetical protein
MCFLAQNYRNVEKNKKIRKNNPKNKIFFAQLYALIMADLNPFQKQAFLLSFEKILL